jgi:alkyldihydroxyacetonephosphate synthase
MTSLLDRLSHVVPGVRASDERVERVAYARDLWPRHHLAVRSGTGTQGPFEPGAIVWPETTDDVVKIVKFCADTGTPLVPFGAGSGVCGGVLPTSRALVLDMKRMARIVSIDEARPSVLVEAGAMGLPFEDTLGRHGFTLGHFPSSIVCSTVGGWIAGRSAGQCSGKYGKIEDMVESLECVTGLGEVVTLHRRGHGPSLLPLVIGSEGTLAVITRATLRLHPKPEARAFAAFAFDSTEQGWEGMRELFQRGLRPAVARLYDPFDAMLARQGTVKADRAASEGPGHAAPGMGPAVLRTILRAPGAMNALVEGLGSRVFGGALLVLVFEGSAAETEADARRARQLLEARGARYEGEGPARKWLAHRYSVSYRQAPVFAGGAFSDTMEVAASWDKLGALYDGVRRALGSTVFVMAHFSHAYPDGCCIYFSFAGSAPRSAAKGEWDKSCEAVYDRTWRAALAAAVDAGGTLAHHHGVGRSKAPKLAAELGSTGISAGLAAKRAFDPKGILNPGALFPPISPSPTLARAGAFGDEP